MKFFNLIKTVTVAAVMALYFANNAFAQSTVLVVDQIRVLRDSDVGKHIQRQIDSINLQMNAEIEAQLKPLQVERDKLREELKGMSEEALKGRPDLVQRGMGLQEKLQKSQLEAGYKQEELKRTEAQALEKIGGTVEVIIKAIVTEKKGDVLVDRSLVMFSSPDVDITEDTISRLNAQIKTIPVVRVRLPRKPLPKQIARPAQ